MPFSTVNSEGFQKMLYTFELQYILPIAYRDIIFYLDKLDLTYRDIAFSIIAQA